MKKEVKIGNIKLGKKNPIVIQSMTDTDTADVKSTCNQIFSLNQAGAEIIRITIDSLDSAKSAIKIIEKVKSKKNIPIVGDFHFNGHFIMQKVPEICLLLDKYRINPGNVGSKNTRDKNFEYIINQAIKNQKPIRIGGNGGSIDKLVLQKNMDKNKELNFIKSSEEIFNDTLIESVIKSADFAKKIGLSSDKIVLSAKVSDVNSMIYIYEELNKKTSQPLHLGLTEAGSENQGIISSSIALGYLIKKNIGDTIRVSITPVNGNRTEEVKIAKQILQSLNKRNFFPKIISCPGCGRTTGNDFVSFTSNIKNKIEDKLPEWEKQNKNITSIKIAIMGCIVNGPGEAEHADIGVFFPGKQEGKNAIIYFKGKKIKELSGNLVSGFIEIIEEKIKEF